MFITHSRVFPTIWEIEDMKVYLIIFWRPWSDMAATRGKYSGQLAAKELLEKRSHCCGRRSTPYVDSVISWVNYSDLTRPNSTQMVIYVGNIPPTYFRFLEIQTSRNS